MSMPKRMCVVNQYGQATCECCGEKTTEPFYLETYAPFCKQGVCYWLCKVCMSRLSVRIENDIVGDPYDALVREETELRTNYLREMNLAKKYRDPSHNPSN